MKKLNKKVIGLGVLGFIAATVPFVNSSPVMATLQQAGEAIVQAIQGPQVRLNLTVDKQTVEVSAEGQEQIVWVDLGTEATVLPGDTLRYTVASENLGDKSAKDLAVTQPISPEMIYVLGSATTSNEAEITYSIDGGETFVMNPMVEVTLEDGTVEEVPAPAEAYTNVRWQFGEELNPETNTAVAYEVTVR